MRCWCAVLLLLPLAGCLDAATQDDLSLDATPWTAADLATRAPLGDGPWPVDEGGIIWGGTCAAQCPVRLQLDEALPEDAWLEVRVLWDGTQTAGFDLHVADTAEDPDIMGAVTDADVTAADAVAAKRGFDAVRVQIWQADAGTHVVEVEGAGELWGVAKVVHRNGPRASGDLLLPDLVTLAPADVGMGMCDPWERTEQGAQRCLRFGNGIGNTGDGPLEVRLSYGDAATHVAADGKFLQRLYQRGGGYDDVPVAAPVLHPTHAHWHYEGLARFQLFAVDPETGLRGEQVTAGHKSGFCLLDIGRMEEADAPENEGHYAEQDCIIPDPAEGWTMGVSHGYFDYYGAGLTDQYVEVSGVGDGLYELVSHVDTEGLLSEVDGSNNAASVLLTITGDEVEVLEERAWYRAW